MYRVVIYKENEDGSEEELHNEVCVNVTMLAEEPSGDHITEIVMGDNLMGIAAKIASSSKIKMAAKLAETLTKIKESMVGDIEESLMTMMNGGDNGWQ